MYHPATTNAIVVYHMESEQVRMIVKDAHTPDDSAWRNVNNDPDGHAMLHIHPDEYNAMDHEALQAHHKRVIPVHKAWYKAEGHQFRNNQKKAAEAFRKHLASLG